MAAKVPAAQPADSLVSKQTQQIVPASSDTSVVKTSPAKAAVSDQEWLDQSQQAWDEQRQKEVEQARAQQGGDRVLQLLDGEQSSVGVSLADQSVLLAQANTNDDSRRAASAQSSEDARKAATLGSGDGVSLTTLLGVGGGLALLAAASGGSGGSSAAPAPAASELLVYSTEDEEGQRSESGDADTNTGVAPFSLVRVKAIESEDTAELDDGSGDTLYVAFSDRDDLAVEVLAQGQSSDAYADLSTDAAFTGEILVSAANVSADAGLNFWTYGSTDVVHSVDVTAEAVSVDARADAVVDLASGGDMTASLDATVSASALRADASTHIYVGSYGGVAALSGDLTVTASGQEASAYGYVSVWNNSDADGSEYVGDVFVAASAENADASADVYLWGEDGGAVLSGDIAAINSGEDAEASVYVSVDAFSGDSSVVGDLSVDDSGTFGSASAVVSVNSSSDGANFSGDVSVDASGDSSDATAWVNVNAGSGDATLSGDLTVTASAFRADADAYVSVASNSGAATVAGDVTVTASSDEADAYACVDVWTSSSTDGAEYVGDVSVDASATSAEAYADVYATNYGSGDAIVSGDVNVATSGQSADASVYVSVDSSSADAYFTGDVTVDALGDDNSAEADVNLYGSGDATASGDLTVTAGAFSADADGYIRVGADTGAAALAGDVTVTASSDEADAYACVDVWTSSSTDGAEYVGDVSVDASATSAEAYADVYATNYGSGDAIVSGDVNVATSGQSADASVYVSVDSSSADAYFTGDVTVDMLGDNSTASAYVDVTASGNAIFSGDLTATTQRGAVNSVVSAELDIVGGSYAQYSGDVLASTDGVSTDAYVSLSLDAGDVDLQGDVTVVAGVRDSSADAYVSVCADSAWIWGSVTETVDSDDTDGVLGSTVTDIATEWTVTAAAQDNSADLYADIWADEYVSAELNVTAQATFASAEASASIYLSSESSSGEVVLQGNEVWAESQTFSSSEAFESAGEDSTRTVEAAQFTSTVAANGASSDLYLEIVANSIDTQVSFLVDAVGHDAYAVTDVYMSAEDHVVLGGGSTYSYSSAQGTDWVLDDALTEGVDETASTNTMSVGEDRTLQAADWVVAASGDGAAASFDLWVDGVNNFSVDLSANVQVQATSGASADAAIVLDSWFNGDLDQVSVSGDFGWTTSIESTQYSAATDNVVGEDTTFALSAEVDAVDWSATASDDAVSELVVSMDAEYAVSMAANLAATAGDDSYAGVDVTIHVGDSVEIGGARSVSTSWTISSEESDLYTANAAGEDTIGTYEAAEWDAVANGANAVSELEVEISADWNSSDVVIAANLNSTASASDSSADINLFINGCDDVTIYGGETFTSTSAEAYPSDDVSMELWTETSTEYAADWQATASGVGACADIEVEVSAEYIDFRVNQAITASGEGSYAATYINLDASTDVVVNGDQSYYESSGDVEESSGEIQNAVWSVAAAGADAVAELEFDASAYLEVNLDIDLAVAATAADSLASAEISASAYYDVYMGAENGATTTVTASGANSVAYTEIDLYSNSGNAVYEGDITVTANAASGLDADAVMVLDLAGEDWVEYDGRIQVSALGADNDASLIMSATSEFNGTGMCGDVYVNAVEGVASMSVNIDGEFNSFLSLDADEGGEVFMSLVADTASTGDIYVYTDNDGEVTLNMDVNYFSEEEDIDVYGDAGGVFNLILQDGFDLAVDLSDDIQGYGGQFNMVVETPYDYAGTSSNDDEVGVYMEIDGFNATGQLLDTIDFQGAAFNGGYASGNVDNYGDFLSDAASALNGSTDYFFGTDGTDGWLAVDGDGTDIAYVIELVGVTNLDWDAVLSTNSFA